LDRKQAAVDRRQISASILFRKLLLDLFCAKLGNNLPIVSMASHREFIFLVRPFRQGNSERNQTVCAPRYAKSALLYPQRSFGMCGSLGLSANKLQEGSSDGARELAEAQKLARDWKTK